MLAPTTDPDFHHVQQPLSQETHELHDVRSWTRNRLTHPLCCWCHVSSTIMLPVQYKWPFKWILWSFIQLRSFKIEVQIRDALFIWILSIQQESTMLPKREPICSLNNQSKTVRYLPFHKRKTEIEQETMVVGQRSDSSINTGYLVNPKFHPKKERPSLNLSPITFLNLLAYIRLIPNGLVSKCKVSQWKKNLWDNSGEYLLTTKGLSYEIHVSDGFGGVWGCAQTACLWVSNTVD